MAGRLIIDRRGRKERAERARRNGARSRGPVSAEGKARSAQNARRHGLCAAVVVDAEEFARFRAGLEEEMRPAYRVEEEAFEAYAVAAFQLRLVRELEGREGLTEAGRLRLWARYRVRWERERDRALRGLQEAQNARFAREAPYRPATVELPPLVSWEWLRWVRVGYAKRRGLAAHAPGLWAAGGGWVCYPKDCS